jgi:heme oxygenase
MQTHPVHFSGNFSAAPLAPAAARPSAMAALKEKSWPVHQRLEKRLAVKDRFADMERYRSHLAQLLAFYAAAEQAWGAWLALALDDFDARRKAALLERDLAAVGGRPLQTVPVLAATDCTAAALGSFYVLEGATLGGQHLLPLAGRRLGLSAAHGASYLASYGAEVDVMWRRFGAAVEAHCQTPQACARAVAAAEATFVNLENWLCGEPHANE